MTWKRWSICVLTCVLVAVAVRTKRFRYAEYGADGSGGAMLFDEAADPHETRNLAGESAVAKKQEEFAALLRHFRAAN